MIPARSKDWVRLVLPLLLLAAIFQPAAAQAPVGSGRLSITPPDLTGFPAIRFELEAYGADGRFIEDLTPAEVSVQEDGRSLSVERLELVRKGVQMVLAINAGPTLLFRYDKGTRYDQILKALTAWMQSQPEDSTDTFTLASNDGLHSVRIQDPRAWLEALKSFKPVLETSIPSLTSLNAALDLSADPEGRKTAILYITPLPTAVQLASLPSLAERAANSGVRISVWLVAQPANATTAEGLALRDLAEKTGGQFTLFSGVESLPNPDNAFQSLRYKYSCSYLSAIRSSQPHTLQVTLRRGDLNLSSQTHKFDLKIQPPNPMFLFPPTTVERAWITPVPEGELELQPVSTNLQIMVEFPDGHTRPLTASRLYVNGELAVTNTVAPFDRFTWPLDAYTNRQKVTLRVEVEDVLGLTGSSIDTPVELVVPPRPLTQWEKIQVFFTPQRLVILGSVLVAMLVLALAMISSRRRPAKRPTRQERIDPLTQPVPIPQVTPRFQSAAGRERAGQSAPPARLVRLGEDRQPIPGGVIDITRRQLTFGSDPSQAIIVLDSPSVSPLHARLNLGEDGAYSLSDAGSAAGTWVNYAPVSAHGARLEHGDLIHFGRLLYRFELSNPVLPEPVVSTPEEEL